MQQARGCWGCYDSRWVAKSLAVSSCLSREVRNDLFRGRGCEHSSRETARRRRVCPSREGQAPATGVCPGKWRPSHRPLGTPAHALSEMGSVGQRRDIYLTLLTAGL